MKYGILLVLVFFFCISNLSADITAQKSVSDKQVELFNMIMRFQLNVYNAYTMTEETQVTRSFQNEKSKEFSRNVKYHYTNRMLNQPEKSFTTLSVVLDSIYHTIKFDGNEVSLNSNTTDFTKWNEDYEQYFIPISKEFDVLIDPYFDIVKLSGEKLAKDRELTYSNEDAMKPQDFALWVNSLSDERLIHICDPKKISYPSWKIGVDSVWDSPIKFQVQGFNVFDTIVVKLKEIRGGYFFFESEFPVRYFQNSASIIFGNRQNLSFIDSLELNAKLKITVSPAYIIDETILEIEGKMNLRDKERTFTDLIKTKYKWNLIGKYK